MNEHVTSALAGVINDFTAASVRLNQEFRTLVDYLTEEELIRVEHRLRKNGHEQLANKLVVERIIRQKNK